MSHPIIKAIEERQSINLFDPTRTLNDEQITELVRLATKAPTAFNLQNWRFIAVKTTEEKEKLKKVSWNQAKVAEASVTFIICGVLPNYQDLADRLKPSVDAGFMPESMVPLWEGAAKGLYFEQPTRSRDEAVRSGTFGAMTLIYAAQAMGLGSSCLIGFDPEGISKEFKLSDNELPVMLLSVGYALEENWPQKPRRPISDILEIV